MTITEVKARQLIADKLDVEAKKLISDFGDIKVLNGMYYHITDGKKNAKIPKGTEAKDITEEQAKKLLDEAPAKGKGRRWGGRKTAPKTTKRVVRNSAKNARISKTLLCSAIDNITFICYNNHPE